MKLSYKLFEKDYTLIPRIELYTVHDQITGKELPGLAVVLDEETENGIEQFAVLTVSFGDVIGSKDCAYVDVNNVPGVEQFLEQGIAEDTGFIRGSGFCSYPLWHFKKEFLEECSGGENYQQYVNAMNKYLKKMQWEEIKCFI